jgi:hypothetical protein
MHCTPDDDSLGDVRWYHPAAVHGAPDPAAFPASMHVQPRLRHSQASRLQQAQHRQHQPGQLYGMPIESWVLPGQGSTGHVRGLQAGSTTYHVSHAGSTGSLEAPRTPDPAEAAAAAAAAAAAEKYVHRSSRRHQYYSSAGGAPVRPSTAPNLQRSSAVWMYSSTSSGTITGAAGGANSAAGLHNSSGARASHGSLWCEVVRECQAEVLEQAMLLSQTASVAAESRVVAVALRSSWDMLHG